MLGEAEHQSVRQLVTQHYNQEAQERNAAAQQASPSPFHSGIAQDSTIRTQSRSSLLHETSLETASQAQAEKCLLGSSKSTFLG